jgi:spermidine synthase
MSAIKLAIVVEDGHATIYSNKNIDVIIADFDTDDPEAQELAKRTLNEIDANNDLQYIAGY